MIWAFDCEEMRTPANTFKVEILSGMERFRLRLAYFGRN
jgi:hypothetical protein